jgi:hypothetical protein
MKKEALQALQALAFPEIEDILGIDLEKLFHTPIREQGKYVKKFNGKQFELFGDTLVFNYMDCSKGRSFPQFDVYLKELWKEFKKCYIKDFNDMKKGKRTFIRGYDYGIYFNDDYCGISQYFDGISHELSISFIRKENEQTR